MTAQASQNERELLTRLAADDKEAFAEIYRQYWEPLLAMAYNRLQDLATAEDIVHDVFASIWHNRHHQQIQSLKNYLATAVKYMILKQARKAMLLRQYRQSEYTPPTQEFIPDTVLDNKRILELLHREIESLPEKCRLIFRYSREQGMSIREIAGEMQITPKTVENQLNKALRKLRVTFKKHALFLLSIVS